MQGKTVSESTVITSIVMMPEDTNPVGNVHGGVIMKHIDTTAGVVAFRHSRRNSVTASLDSMVFHYPVFIGDLLTLKASIHHVSRTSMDIGVRVETENLLTGEVRHTASAYLTFVAVDKSGRPAQVPPLILETNVEKRRHKMAVARRTTRLEQKKREKTDKDF